VGVTATKWTLNVGAPGGIDLVSGLLRRLKAEPPPSRSDHRTVDRCQVMISARLRSIRADVDPGLGQHIPKQPVDLDRLVVAEEGEEQVSRAGLDERAHS
jgi:hypothetical protein